MCGQDVKMLTAPWLEKTVYVNDLKHRIDEGDEGEEEDEVWYVLLSRVDHRYSACGTFLCTFGTNQNGHAPLRMRLGRVNHTSPLGRQLPLPPPPRRLRPTVSCQRCCPQASMGT